MYINDIQEDVISYRINRIQKQISDLTYKTVGKIQNRNSGYMEIPIQNLDQIQQKLINEGKVGIPLYKTSSNNYYTNDQSSKQDLYRLQVFAKENIDIDNHLDMFGYPKCCKTFFSNEWGNDKVLDTTIKMQENTKNKKVNGNTTEIKINPYTNMMLRFIGVRPVFHLPCQFDCKHTEQIAKEIIQFGYKNGYQQEMDWMLDLLNLDVKYDSYHQTQFIETQYFKIAVNTDYLYKNKIVKLTGGEQLDLPDKSLWIENGFNKYQQLEKQHNDLIQYLKTKKFKSIVDFGCGNGYLLSKINQKEKIGVDNKTNFKNSFQNIEIINNDIQNVINQLNDKDIKLISIFRIIENPELINKIEKQNNFIIYSYNKNKKDIYDFFDLFKIVNFNIKEYDNIIIFEKGD